jgi:Peptidase family M23
VYAHLATINVAEGDNVLRGQILGTVRENILDDGTTDDSHLHFEVRHFEDGENIYPITTDCNGKAKKAGVGYTYPEHPDNFPSPGLGYTDPLAFINNRRGMSLPIVQKAELPTPTHTPIPSPTPLPTPTHTPTPTCVGGRDLVKNGNFENVVEHALWVSNSPDIALITAYITTPEPDYGLLLGYENNADHQIHPQITVPHNTKSLTLKFYVYVRSQEWAPFNYDYLYIELLDDATSRLLLEQQIEPITNRFSPQGVWVQQTYRIDNANQLAHPIKLAFRATTNWALPTAFYVDIVQLITGC